MPFEDRKVFAEQVTMAFWRAIGGDEDELEGLDDDILWHVTTKSLDREFNFMFSNWLTAYLPQSFTRQLSSVVLIDHQWNCSFSFILVLTPFPTFASLSPPPFVTFPYPRGPSALRPTIFNGIFISRSFWRWMVMYTYPLQTLFIPPFSP